MKLVIRPSSTDEQPPTNKLNEHLHRIIPFIGNVKDTPKDTTKVLAEFRGVS